MRKVYAFVALAVIALGIAAYPRASKPAAHATPADRAELTRLSGQLEDERAAREREIAKLEAQLRSLTNAQQAPGAQPDMPKMTVIGTEEPEAREPAPEPGDPVDPVEHLESAFADQPTDAAWASTTEAHITQKVSAALPGARVQAVECHASLCRLETVHADVAAYGQFLNESKQLWRGEAFSQEPTEGAQGQLVVVSYLAREGEPLARMQ